MKAVGKAWPILLEEQSEWWHPQTDVFLQHHGASREMEVKTAPFLSPAPGCSIPWAGSSLILLHWRGEQLEPQQDKLSKASGPPDLDTLHAL